MKKLKLDLKKFQIQKESLKTIYGGYGGYGGFGSDQNTITVGDNGGETDDGDDSSWDQ